jgi:hypothetical protein
MSITAALLPFVTCLLTLPHKYEYGVKKIWGIFIKLKNTKIISKRLQQFCLHSGYLY